MQGEMNDIVLFDGVCNLCNSSVDFVVRHERDNNLRFASLQSDFATALLAEHGIVIEGDPDSIVVVKNGVLLEQSDAAMAIASHLKMPWRIVAVGKLVPKFLRDRIYDWVAKNRYRWFGKKETCRIPTPEERSRFLGAIVWLFPLLSLFGTAQHIEITQQFREDVQASQLHPHYKSQLLDSVRLVESMKRVHLIATGSSSGWHDDSEDVVTMFQSFATNPLEGEDYSAKVIGFQCNNSGVGGFVDIEGWFSDTRDRESRALLYFYKGIVRNGFNTDLGNSRGKTGGGLSLERLNNGTITVNDFAWYVELNEAGDSWDPVDGMDNYSDTILGCYNNGQIWFPVVYTTFGEQRKPRQRELLLDFNRDGRTDTLLVYDSQSYANWDSQIILAEGTDTICVPHLLFSSVEHDSLSYYGEQFPVVEQTDSTLTITYITERDAKQTMSYGVVWNEILHAWLFDLTLTQGNAVGNNPSYTRIEEFDAMWTFQQ